MPGSASDQSFSQSIDLMGRLTRTANFALDYWWLWPLALAGLWVVFRLRAQHALIAKLDERVEAAHGDVDAVISERHALIGNLVSVVRAFAAQEKEMIRDVLDARVDALEALGDVGINVETQIANSLKNLFSVSEQYPQLASEAHYRALRQDLVRIEERITAVRKFFNLAVEEANAVRRSFPANLVLMGKGQPRRTAFSLGERRAQLAEPVEINL